MTVLKISYSYYRYDGAAPGGNGFCSNHHILPYHLMYLIGIICVALAKKKDESDKYSYADKLLAIAPNAGNLNNLLAQVKVDEKFAYQFPKNETRRDGNGQIVNTNLYLGDVVGVLSWNQYNIFKGPRGLSRMDDPSQLGEPVKPPSFPAKRWEKLVALLNMYASVGVKSAASNDDRVNYEIGYASAKQIAQFFLDNITPSTTSHQTLVSDWILVDKAKKKYKCAIDLKTPEAYRAIELSTNAKDTLSTDLLFKCNDASGVESNVYFSVVKVDRGTGKLFAVKRSGEPTPENSSREFEGLFATY